MRAANSTDYSHALASITPRSQIIRQLRLLELPSSK